MSKFSPDEDVNASSSDSAGSGGSGFSADSVPSPDTIAANTIAGLPANRSPRPEPATTPGGTAGGETAPYFPNPQDAVYAQTYPQYPTATPAAPGGYPPVTPPVYPGQPVPPALPGQPVPGESLPIPPAYPGQPMPGGSGPVPPAYPASQPIPPNIPGQTVPPVYPSQPVPGRKGKSRRGLIVTVCVILVLALCVLGITLFKVFTGEDSLAVGVKPAWDNAATVELEPEGEPGMAYTLYWSGKDKLILIQPSKDGTGIAQMLDPKTGTKTGSPIVLPKCVNSLKYPYQIKNEKIVCATTENFRANSNKKYHFKERIYADKRLIVGASPSATSARQIVAYSPKTSKLLWVQNLKTPSSVTCNGKQIYTTFAPKQSSTANKQKLKLMVYTGSSQAQKSPEKQLGHPQESKPKETKPQIAKDAIKNIDFANTYLPAFSLRECLDENFWEESDETPILRKMPSETSHCWVRMQNGKSVETHAPWPDGVQEPIVELSKRDDPMYFFDSASFTADTSRTYDVVYGDVNGDGYLDALFTTSVTEGEAFTLALFDPEDPEHPYLSTFHGMQAPDVAKIVAPGQLGFYGKSGSSDAIHTIYEIEGHDFTGVAHNS